MNEEAVRRQALHPFRELPVPPSFERFEQAGVTIVIHPMPMAQVVEPTDEGPADVEAAVEAARAAVRARGKSHLIWWVTPEHDHLAADLERLGLVHEDTPGFERVENAMVLLGPPAGDPVEGVKVELVETLEQFKAAGDVGAEAFGFTEEMRAQQDRAAAERFADLSRPEHPARTFIASIDGRPVGTATGFVGHAGINLFGGSVVESARGRGVYRALVEARWDLAKKLGAPALTMQAGRQSQPIAERLGFELVAAAKLYVDTL